MALVSSKRLLIMAQEGGFAIGAFNVENMEMVLAVIRAAEELRSPVILQTTPSTVRYAGLPMYYANIKTAAQASSVPVAMHLDHGNSFDLAMQALRVGYTSIMIDGSQLPFKDNIALTRQVVEACEPTGVPVEAELGKVGGKEDDLSCDDPGYTDPGDAAEFVSKTGISSLAVAIGTAHGIYKGEPRLDLERLTQIRESVSIPLVLHGASGVPDDTVRECIRRGISKVNFATELRIAYSDGVKDYLREHPDAFDPKKYGAAAMARVTSLVKEKILVCGSDHRERRSGR